MEAACACPDSVSGPTLRQSSISIATTAQSVPTKPPAYNAVFAGSMVMSPVFRQCLILTVPVTAAPTIPPA